MIKKKKKDTLNCMFIFAIGFRFLWTIVVSECTETVHKILSADFELKDPEKRLLLFCLHEFLSESQLDQIIA